MERGSLFTHTALSETAERVTEVETFLYGLINVLVADKAIDQGALGQAAAAVRAELDQRGEAMSPGVALRVDTDVPADTFVPVNCAERMHVCRAVCCRLNFALSAAEVESGTLKWDLGRPYQIRQDATGTCVHIDPENHGCSVYADRPGVCRGYSCANDQRIWSDFENMQLNTAWIEENLHGVGPRLAHAAMVRLPDPVVRPDAT
ncbi:YkgJ family cysteine cluster protein [Actinopolymorpha rutila]|uniref:Fe-S-cluster containining protein n=1 Tax=Actinopolymorpha rutila TaxID=446787 RepID=A0A852ZP35_9ACTN|nr:Fe-S-cluster containining protein [Actinopolymorpha rutila]